MQTTTSDLPFLDAPERAPVFVTDGGIETTLIFHEGIDLPEFAAYRLLKSAAGRRALEDYYRGYAALGQKYGVGIVLDTPTWRASADWGRRLGDDAAALDDANRRSVGLLLDLRARYETAAAQIVVGGTVGPRYDGYVADTTMSASEAAAYHSRQVRQLADAGVDVITALTMTTPNEAIGITDAARAVDVRCAIGFTVETDGRLPNGDTLRIAINAVDEATNGSVAYYLINCAHPTHFAATIDVDEPWVQRIRGVRANASAASHAELDEAEELDSGDPVDLADQLWQLRARHPHLTLLGGCCGTDERHIAQLASHFQSER